jgi:ATP-dependent DNA helicase RecQ
LSITTIFSHLSQLYSEGKEVNLHQFVEANTIEKVRKVYKSLNKENSLKPIYEKLEEQVSYGEIRLSIAIIQKDE